MEFPTSQQQGSLSQWQRWWPVAAVLLSAVFALLRAGPLHGSDLALVITVVLQFYLPGALLIRALRIERSPHPIIRFVWALAGAVGLTVTLGALLRFLAVPVATYQVVLHGVMLVLAVIHTSLPPTEPIPWRFQARNLPLYALVALCCAAVVYVAVERDQYRFSGYEDQSVFVELAEWMAHGTDPIDILSRRVGVLGGDTRWDTDGWTYNQAAWVATSGVSAADLIWFRVTPLFVWTAPLAIFALAFELTRRETTAAWATAALTLLGLMTVDSLATYPTTITFGQFSLFQVNTLRTVATALVTPLALLPLLAYLQTSSRRFLIVGLLTGCAVAFMHPRQIVIVLYSIGAAGLLQTLAHPNRKQVRHAAFAAAVLALLVLIPVSQAVRRTASFQMAAATAPPPLMEEATPAAEPSEVPAEVSSTATGFRTEVLDAAPRARYLVFSGVPLIGSTYIVDPTFVFYHPLIVLATALGLVIGVAGWRRGLTAQYILGATVFSLILLFVPILVPIYTRMVTSALVAGSIFGVPFALILGLTFEGLLDRIGQRGRSAVNALIAAALIALMGLLLFEPFPIPASARDQIRASNALQETRAMLPADQALIDRLTATLDAGSVSVVLSPNRVANYISESVPRTYITGGRESSNFSYEVTQVFEAESSASPPFITQREGDAARRWQVSHIVLQADNWRLAQMALEPEQFEAIGASPGYLIFRFGPPPIAPEMEALDTAMNQAVRQTRGRWTGNRLDLTKPGLPDVWTPLDAQADALPDGDRADLARAFARTMAGDDAGALPLWQKLAQTYVDVPVFARITAETMALLGQPEAGATLLFERIDSDEPSTRVAAARELMTDSFFYLLTSDQVERILDVTEADADTWTLLAELDRAGSIRQRAALLLSAGQADTAEQWLKRLPTAEVRPEDLLTEATIELSRGNVDAALALLQPATDTDWTVPNRHLHPDWWQNNVAAQTYHLLRGEIARRAKQSGLPEFESAVQLGSDFAGGYFLANAEYFAGRTNESTKTMEAVNEAWKAAHSDRMPELLSLLTLADTRQLYVMSPTAEVDDNAHTIKVTATFGNAHGAPLSVRTWRMAVLSSDGSQTYARQDVPAVFAPGALSRVRITLTLPTDIPILTGATVYIQPRYDNRIAFGSLTVPVVLNRPGDAVPPSDASAINARFSDSMTLVSAAASADAKHLTLALYWRAERTPADAYQVFVHVLDANGQIVAQRDSAPADGRYPTDQWRTDTLIEDSHALTFDTPLPPGTYRVVTGLYRLSDLEKLPISGMSLPVLDGRLQVFEFTTP